MRSILGIFVIVLGFCGLESAMNVNGEQDYCTFLCSQLSNDFPEENSKSLNKNQILQDSLVEKKCDCKNYLLKDISKRKRRSVATSSNPQPTTSIGNQTTVKNITTEKDKNEIPGFSPSEGIKFVSPSLDLSNYTLKKPSKFVPLPRPLLKHMYPQIFKASTYCNYTVGNEDRANKGKYMESIDVAFEDHAPASFNVTWVPPKDLDNVTHFLVLWNGQRKSNEVPEIKHSYIHCKIVPKNQTCTVIEEDKDAGWEYPQSLYINVVTVPQDIYGHSIPLRVFNPLGGNPMVIPVPRKQRVKDATLQKGSIAGGVIAGVAFITVLFVLLYRKKCGHSESPDNELGLIVPYANNSDGLPKVLNADSKPKNVDIYFGSYLPESEKYANEVATIASMLRANGYRVVFDQVDSVELNSMGFNLWVEKQILEAKKYIVFCSPGYVKLWQTLATNAQDSKLDHINKEDLVRVRYEIKRITDIYSESCSTSKIICIKMDQKMSMKSLPPWMNHNMLLWPEQKFDIIRRLNDQAAMIMDL